jgi:hypothetical protein
MWFQSLASKVPLKIQSQPLNRSLRKKLPKSLRRKVASKQAGLLRRSRIRKLRMLRH